MGFSVHSIASGSSGNAVLIRGGRTNILLDAGLSPTMIGKRLSKFRLSLKDLDGIFLTHEHGDHSNGAHFISSRFDTPIIANPRTLDALSRRNPISRPITLDTGTSISIGELQIESFPVSHDSADPVGYSILHEGRKVCFVTDTGIIDNSIQANVEGAQLLMVEANHDLERLRTGPYPDSLKARVLGEYGHLSNEDAAKLVVEQVQRNRGLSCIWLAHLSSVNNSPRMARRHVQSRLSEAGCRNVVLDVMPRTSAGLTWRAS